MFLDLDRGDRQEIHKSPPVFRLGRIAISGLGLPERDSPAADSGSPFWQQRIPKTESGRPARHPWETPITAECRHEGHSDLPIPTAAGRGDLPARRKKPQKIFKKKIWPGRSRFGTAGPGFVTWHLTQFGQPLRPGLRRRQTRRAKRIDLGS